MKLSPKELKKTLVDAKLLTSDQFDLAEKNASDKNIPIEEFLPQSGFISDEHLGQVIADYLKLDFINLSKQKIPEEILLLVPHVVAKSQKAVIFKEDLKYIYIATSQPDNYEFFKLLEKKTSKEAKIHYVTPLGMKEVIKHYASDLLVQVENILRELKLSVHNEEATVKLVNLFLEYAYDNGASDIHIEPMENEVLVRFRIDGVLHEAIQFPKELHDKIVFRIKIMSSLRTDEHAAAQDGRFSYKKEGTDFDVRVSILPIDEGENVVMRILAEQSRKLSLEELGLLEPDLEKIRRAIFKPYGMVLAVGPTGSGKTTTLYAILHILNRPEINIMSIEDPIEYDVDHVQQTQVNPKKNLTFATGLRAIVRQDPDVIMVGEIRDNETSGIAINSAMTGHLVLSTLHSNNAATTFPRLIEMGIEPFLVASSVNVIVAQRLVRKVCEQCRKSYFLTKDEIKLIELEPGLLKIIQEVSGESDLKKLRFYKGEGCKVCNDVGYKGRTGIFEVMEIGDEIRPLIVQKASADIIEKKAKESGMTSMMYDGVTKMFEGITTLDEVLRVTKS